MRPAIPSSFDIEREVFASIHNTEWRNWLFEHSFKGRRQPVPTPSLPNIVEQIQTTFEVLLEPIDIADKTVLGIAGEVQKLIASKQEKVALT